MHGMDVRNGTVAPRGMPEVLGSAVGRREAQDDAGLSFTLSLLSSTPQWNGNFNDGHTENFVEGSTDSMEPSVKSRKLFGRC